MYRGSSRTITGVSGEWARIGGGDGMYVQVNPRDGTTYFGFQFGFYTRSDASGKRQRIRTENR